MEINTIISGTLLKALTIALMIYIAKKWNHGELKSPIKTLKKHKRKHGIITASAILTWWLITPTGTPDDIITLWLIKTIGLLPSIIIIALLTVFIIWKLRITMKLYKKR